MPSFSALSHIALAHSYLIYIVLFPFAVFGGPAIALLAGFFVRLGYMDPFAAYAVMAAGDFFPDTLFYCIGRYAHKKSWIERLSKRFTSKAAFFTDNHEIAEKLWKNHFRKMIIFSKQAYGLSVPLLVSAGLADVPYGRFIRYALSATLLQYLIFMSLGYWLGSSYALAEKYIQYAGWIAALIVIIFIAIFAIVQKRVRTAFMRMESEEK